MDKLYKYKDVVQILVDVIEQAEQNNDIVIVDRPMGWESIRAYAEEVVSDIPSVEQTIEIDADQLAKLLREGWTIHSEPKQGEWIGKGDCEAISVKCSICGRDNGLNASNFCPNCGARMKGADDE